ncbi:MAG: SOS response-associated peptidase [Gemmatimonadetes bacterium]|nr:SOS response-associated peptidase [Gemmatimonadota bacterium]
MCGRLTITTPASTLANMFGASPAEADEAPRYNVAPTQTVLTLGQSEAGRSLGWLNWGMRARRPVGRPRLVINARSDTLGQRPMFAGLMDRGRCAVLADSFFEWREEGGLKRPYLIRRRDRRPLVMAALRTRQEGGQACVIVTTEANELLAPLHLRMPAILGGGAEEPWIGRAPAGEASECLAPLQNDLLEAVPLGTRVNGTANDDAGCIEPAGQPVRTRSQWAERPATGPAQTSLF